MFQKIFRDISKKIRIWKGRKIYKKLKSYCMTKTSHILYGTKDILGITTTYHLVKLAREFTALYVCRLMSSKYASKEIEKEIYGDSVIDFVTYDEALSISHEYDICIVDWIDTETIDKLKKKHGSVIGIQSPVYHYC